VRPLTTTLTPAEVAILLDIPPALVDALLDSGRILCHVKGGQPRVPLAQLEEFFREALIRVYQGEAPAAADAPAVLPSREEGEEPSAGVAESSTASQGRATSGIHMARPRRSMPTK